MNAIIPRKTVEQVVAARDETLRLYEAAFAKIEEASEALSQARMMWKEASPSLDGRYYEAGRETQGFFDVVNLPDREQWLATARRLVDITVWQHVVEVSGIEDLMDRQEKEKLRAQMKYRAPSFRSAAKFIEELQRYVDWAEDEQEPDAFRPTRGFKGHLNTLKDDPETFEALGAAGIETVRGLAIRMVDAVRKKADGTHWMEDLTTSVDAFEQMIVNPRGLPPVTVENIMATVQGLVGQSNEIFMRGLANSFSSLDRRFRSHDGFKIGSRIIIDRLCDPEFGHINYGSKEDTLVDIERIFMVLDGLKPGALYGSIVHKIRKERGWNAGQTQHMGDYFEARIFKNGNAHLWFSRKDLVTKVNKLLAEYYGEVVADGMTKEEDPLKNVKTTPAKNHGFFPTPDAAANLVFKNVSVLRGNCQPRMRILEPSAGTGNLARRCISSPEIFKTWSGDPQEHAKKYRFDNLVDCIEVQPQLAAQLEAAGIYNRVTCANFLEVQPDQDQLYDLVVMNPPFDRERDIDHVNHALKFLKPDGFLIAIMSAGTEFRETKKSIAFRKMIQDLNGSFHDLPAGSFSSVGTYVNTVLLRVYKNGQKPRWINR